MNCFGLGKPIKKTQAIKMEDLNESLNLSGAQVQKSLGYFAKKEEVNVLPFSKQREESTILQIRIRAEAKSKV